MKYVPELTGLRALAVFLAFSEHAAIPNLQGGWIGVDIFFVLSGYLITTILVAEWRRTDTIRLGRFYAKRALRLYPALILMLALGAFFYHYLGDGGTLVGYGKTALLGASYTQDFALGFFYNAYGQLGHTWSLAVEEQFYLFWAPVLLLLLKCKQRPVLWLIGFIALSWLSLALTTTHLLDPPKTYYRPDTRMNELFLGCLIAFFLERYGGALQRSRFLRLVLGPLGLAAIICIEIYSNAHGRLYSYPQQEIGAGLAAAVLLIGLVIATPAAPLNRLFQVRPIVWLGTISYGIYLYFIPVIVLLDVFFTERGWTHDNNALLAAQIVCTLGMASLSYYLVERRFLALKDRLNDRAPRRRPRHARTRPDRGRAPANGVGFGWAVVTSTTESSSLPAPSVPTPVAEGRPSVLHDREVPRA
jgi:peptidoglycan/LPS O-acetylase OafA/YrhL